ncbi:hypothetical protein Tco_1172316 [Tanacetum coccineum]
MRRQLPAEDLDMQDERGVLFTSNEEYGDRQAFGLWLKLTDFKGIRGTSYSALEAGARVDTLEDTGSSS